jgi:hypothetical protein
MVVTWSALVDCARGNLGGQVASRNTAGDYITGFIKPHFPGTIFQTQSDSNFTAVLLYWQQLNDTERGTWISAAASGDFDFLNKCGTSFHPSGQQLFTKLNLQAFDFSFPIRSAPSLPIFTIITFDDMTADIAGGITVTYNTGSLAADEGMIIYASRLLSVGVNSPGPRPLRKIIYVDDATFLSSFKITTEWEARFGDLKQGYSIFVNSVILSESTGVVQDLGTIRAIVS